MTYLFFKELHTSSKCSMRWDGKRSLIMVGFCILSLEWHDTERFKTEELCDQISLQIVSLTTAENDLRLEVKRLGNAVTFVQVLLYIYSVD